MNDVICASTRGFLHANLPFFSRGAILEPKLWTSTLFSMLRTISSRYTSFCKIERRPLCFNVAAGGAKDAPTISATIVADNSSSTPSNEQPARKASKFLKFTLISSLTGAALATGYATYAYSSDELDDKTKDFRASTSYKIDDHGSTLDKFQAFLYNSSVGLPAKAIDLYLKLRRSIEDQVRGFIEPSSDKLLPDLHPLEQHVFTLVLDLRETLVYTDWKRETGRQTFKRPGVDSFLEHLAQFYEIVVYSDEPSMYVDPVIERLDGKGAIRYRLSRSATRYQNGKHYRDLLKLNRDPCRILYVSAYAVETSLQPENCVPIKPWKLDADDTTLLDLIPFLEYVARQRPGDIRPVLESYQGHDIATEFIKRSKEHHRRMQEQKQQGFFRRR